MSDPAAPIKQAAAECLSGLKIARGDTVFLHSDAIVVAQFPGLDAEQRIHALLDAIDDYLGPNGTLVLPTFTYSFTKNEVFDVLKTPSTVGMITDIFRRRPGVSRNADPIFSVAASGAGRAEFAGTNSRECFGADSIFGLLHRRNAWIAGLGCGFNTTFVHYVEKCAGVNYRYEKLFTGTIVADSGSQRRSEASYFVRDLQRKTASSQSWLERVLNSEGLLRDAALGRLRAWRGARERDYYASATAAG